MNSDKKTDSLLIILPTVVLLLCHYFEVLKHYYLWFLIVNCFVIWILGLLELITNDLEIGRYRFSFIMTNIYICFYMHMEEKVYVSSFFFFTSFIWMAFDLIKGYKTGVLNVYPGFFGLSPIKSLKEYQERLIYRKEHRDSFWYIAFGLGLLAGLNLFFWIFAP